MGYGEAAGQGWLQLGEVTAAFVLSSLIGHSARVDARARACGPLPR
jgi:hypothetical protein